MILLMTGFRKAACLAAAAVWILFGFAGVSLADSQELLYNGDFSVYADGEDLPAGWFFTAYDPGATDCWTEDTEGGGRAVCMTSYARNDARVVQKAAVEGNRVYDLSCDIRTEDVAGGTGATLSIDNYSTDGTYCYSENLHGTRGWTRLTMSFRTGMNQKEVTVALRLGGYGTMAYGEVSFANVSLKESAQSDPDLVINLMSEHGTVSFGDTDPGSDPNPGPDSDGKAFTLMVAATLLVAAGCFFLYRNELRFEQSAEEDVPGAGRILVLILSAAFVARVLLSLLFYGHSTDINCFMAWGNAICTRGIREFYTSGMFADYPPGYMYVCGALSWICRLFSVPYGSDMMALVFKMPATLADLAATWILYRFARRHCVPERYSLLIAALYAFCPVLMYVSGAWGQIDSLLGLMVFLTMMLLEDDRPVPAGALYGLAILTKPQALMFGPVLAAAYLLRCLDGGAAWKRRVAEMFGAVVAALAVLFAFSLPFRNGQPFGWLIERYLHTSGSYPYMAIEAFNFASLIGGNWKVVGTEYLGLPYTVWGTAGIAVSVIGSIALYWAARKKNSGALYLCASLMIVGIFTFGHFMHERYLLPALILMLAAYVCYRDRRILIAFLMIGTCALFNALLAMYIVDHQSARTAYYLALTACGSAAEVFSALYYAYTAVEAVRGKQPEILTRKESGSFGEIELPQAGSILPEGPTDISLHLGKRDWIAMAAVTAVYAVFAFLNLGTVSFPESVYYASTPGEAVEIRFDGVQDISEILVNGNIGNSGTLLFSDGRDSLTVQQKYDDMFRWKSFPAGFLTDSLTVSLYSGTVAINEIAFLNEKGEHLPVRTVNGPAADCPLIDEQDTVPPFPSYYNGMYFDELYHARTAYEHLHVLAPYENSHPPLGKILIMLGIMLFGMTPFGWRFTGTLIGVLMLPVMYVLAKRLLRKSEYAFLSMTLFALDFMHFTQTRIATIDVYAVFFILLMYYFMLEYMQMNFYTDPFRSTLRPLFWSGLFFGIGAACKWTGFYAGAGLAVLVLITMIRRYREKREAEQYGSPEEKEAVRPFFSLLVRTCMYLTLFFVVIPFLIYFLSYTPYYIYEAESAGRCGLGEMLRSFWNYQTFMFDYHSGLNATHPYQSMWYTWPFTIRPMWYYSGTHAGMLSTITASGNPAVWWVSAVCFPVFLWFAAKGKWKGNQAVPLMLVGILSNYLPWVMVTRCTFIYHYFATMPFVLLQSCCLLSAAEEREASCRIVRYAWIGFALLFLILLYPGISGLPIPFDYARFLKYLPGGNLMYGA